MKIAQELRAGSTIKIGNDPFVVLKAEYNKSGRNAAVVKFKMKNLISGNISDAVYKADDKMDDIKFFILNFTTAAFLPDLLYSAFSTTNGSFPILIVLPALNSCAIFIIFFLLYFL